MKSWVFKLFTLLLTVFLLLSFTLPAFARRPNHLRKMRDSDEQPYPGAAGGMSYFMVLKTANGFVLIPFFVKASPVSQPAAIETPTGSSRKNEIVE